MNAVLIASVLALVGVGDLPAQGSEAAVESWELGLAGAIRIGLANSEVIRIIPSGNEPGCCPDAKGEACQPPSRGASVTISGSNVVSGERFKSEVMAHVRSVEQLYWTLAQQQTCVSACRQSIALTKEILAKAQAAGNSGRGNPAEVAAITERLEQFKLDLATATTGLITTEGQLRNILGLPAADSRRIVACTQPAESFNKPDWDECLSTMKAMQPDIVGQRAIVMKAAFRLFTAQAGTLFDPSEARAATTADARSAFDTFLKQEAFLQQVVRQTTRSLTRFFRELEGNHKDLQNASRLRVAAKTRLEAQRALYEEGRVTVDRYLDAMSQYARAIAEEAQVMASYNISFVALEEAKGTLLAYNNIIVAESPLPSTNAEGTKTRPLDFDRRC